MQKNYRDFTVGELLDMGFNMDIWHHAIKTEEEAVKLARQFENTKQTTDKTNWFTKNARAKGVKVWVFYEEETK